MDRGEIEINLRALGQKLAQRDLIGEILLLGGAYMLLVIQNRGATNDIDAYFAVEPEAIREAVAEDRLSMKTKLTLETLFEEDS